MTPMSPAKAELLAQLQERQRLDVASRNGLWERYYRERGRWTAPVAGEGKPEPGGGGPVPSPDSRLLPLLERAAAQKNFGAVLVIVRQAIQLLHDDERSKLLG